jgi:rhomboid domain-containing protein 1
MFSNRRRGRGGFPLFLLAFQVLRALSGGNELFPVTLALIIGNVAAFIQPSFGGQRYSRYSSANFNWPDIEDICISAGDVWYKHQWKRLVLSPFFHLDEWHIYYNMISLLWKGISLERHFGSAYFLYMTSVFSVLTGVVYCGLQFLLSEYFGSSSYVWQCAAGFSGVLFAFKVVTTYGMPQHTVYIMGFIPIPSRHATWAELILIHVLVPRSSFTGHLAGILVGLLYVKDPLKLIMDLPLGGTQWLGSFSGRQPRFQGSGQSGYRNSGEPPHNPVHDHHRGVSDDEVGEEVDNDSEDEALQIAIRQSLADRSRREPHYAIPTTSSTAPPPYNPEYTLNTHPSPEGATTGESDVNYSNRVNMQEYAADRSSLRQRPPQGRQPLDELRAARLSRFEQSRK